MDGVIGTGCIELNYVERARESQPRRAMPSWDPISAIAVVLANGEEAWIG